MPGGALGDAVSDGTSYGLILFDSVHHALKAEKILKNKDIIFKLIPVPKEISSDCGVCLRFLLEDRASIEDALADKVQYREIRTL